VNVKKLAEHVTLPCGAVLKNRIAKAAMTEGLASGDNHCNDRFIRLYEKWGRGGAGLLISGNVLVDRWHLERGGNLAIMGQQSNSALAALADMASKAKAHGSHIWMQLNHAGRQTQKMINRNPKAPSHIGLKMGNGRFGTPTPLTIEEIKTAQAAFVHAARIAESTGFDGVQMHAAHGYLVSQFLSPLSNRREDAYGGPLENRARFLIETVRAIRSATARTFAVSVKLNSADFQKGGFDDDESAMVAKWLEEAGVDLIEVSGGNYEQPRMIDFTRKDPLDSGKRESTKLREAYFLDFVPKLRAKVSIPVMVTGGFRTVAAMEQAVAGDGVDMIGLGRPMVIDPDCAAKILAGKVTRLVSRDDDLVIGNGLLGPRSPISFLRDLNAWGALGWYYEHMYSMADGKDPNLLLSALRALLSYDRTEGKTAKALVR
jgi:2,4-dienoyl-CoA reductase-like NADH-dependent reductase (Old Yellow Enzyme family)